uniref:Phosphorylated adapter RNA export protein n=1 Tax=Xenopus tropicalis TaxID=8364 RepID=A0A803JY26_XENTR
MALDAAREMMEDEGLEDGELSGSDTDMRTSGVGNKGQQKTDLITTSLSYRSNSTLSNNVPYRTTKGLDSSEDSASDSDDEDGSSWKRKRQKCTHPAPKMARPLPVLQGQQRPIGTGGTKRNNVWGAVLQEQTQEAVATELGIMDMEGQLDMSRQSETYNYILARKLMEKTEKEEELKLDKELDEYMQEDKESAPKEENGHLKRKRPIKERLGERLEMDYKGRYEITEADSEDKVSDEIAHRLREPKKDLIERVVKTLGTKKAIELLMETAEVEHNGGLFILEIFCLENQKEQESKKAAKKRRRHLLGKKMKEAIKGLNFQEHDDTSRETFASDTNEALASLDDEHTEMKADTEDAIEIDNSHDLETF